MRICKVDGCKRRHYARTLCAMHYQRATLRGELDAHPRALVRPGASLDERLRHFGWTIDGNGCWTWNGSRDNNNYGQLAVGGSAPMKAPRAAYKAWRGNIPDGMVICHTCDNPPCINPEHLFVGSRRDNNVDMAGKKRSANGERKKHKLTDEQVVEIRERYMAGGVSQTALGREYGVSQQLIGLILARRRRAQPTHPLPEAAR